MQKFSKMTGISVVVANMIGTGVFTSLGFQLLGIQSYFAPDDALADRWINRTMWRTDLC